MSGGFASGRFVMVALGLGESFWATPLVAPADKAPYERIGLTERSPVYFATRSAPLGVVPVEVVTATFFGFHADKVARYIPAVWETTTPAAALDAQRAVVDDTLHRLLGDWATTPAAPEVAALVRAAAEHCEVQGRPLFAAFASLPWPDPADTLLTTWHGFTLLREFRGDSHIAVLVANDVDACECHLLVAAAAAGGCACHRAFARMGIRADTDTPPNPAVPTDREWPVADRRAALQRLCDRGLLRADGTITDAGMAFHLDLERATDTAATSRWERGNPHVERLAELIREPAGLLRKSWNTSR